jgi:DNA-binding transcriptional LysR family regulator
MNPAFNSLSVSQLTALSTILEIKNLSRAATKLGTSQAGVSRHLAQFREAFDDPLMVRRHREYILTERGEAILAPLRDILEQLEGISSPAEFSPATCDRRFRIATSDYVAESILPEMMAEFAVLAPKVSIEFRPWQPDQYDWLADGQVDLIVSMIEATPEDYHGRILGEDKAVCCMRSAHPLAKLDKIEVHQYLNWPHLKINTGGEKDSFIEAYLRKLNLSRDLKLAVPSYSAALAVLLHNDLLLTLPGHIARKWADKADVCYVPLAFIEHRFRYWVIWHSRTHNSPDQRWFRQLVSQHCRRSEFTNTGDQLPAHSS